jgi:hypothetical protein
MLEENVDYELVPSDNDSWNVRILNGPFTETVISFGKLQFNEEEETLHYNFTIIESPDMELTVENETLQEYSRELLSSILESAFENKK